MTNSGSSAPHQQSAELYICKHIVATSVAGNQVNLQGLPVPRSAIPAIWTCLACQDPTTSSRVRERKEKESPARSFEVVVKSREAVVNRKSGSASGDEAQMEIRARLCKRPSTPEDGRRARLAYIGWSGMQTRLARRGCARQGTHATFDVLSSISAVPARPSARLA